MAGLANNSQNVSFKKFSVVTYNVHGFNQGKSLLPDLYVTHDVVPVQEHWLTPAFLFRINSIAKDFVRFNMSSMDDAISGGLLVGRPYGGLSILVRNNLAARAVSYCR